MTAVHEWVARESYYAPRNRIVYVPTPKVACTSIKNALVQAEDAWLRTESPTSLRQSGSSLHRRETHSLGSVADLAPERLEEILHDPDWIRFCVTRRPYERLASAWVEKILLTDPALPAEFQTLTVANRTPAVGSHFREFVRGLGNGTNKALDDPHFSPQSTLLDVEGFAYTHVLDLSELGGFAEWIRTTDESRQGFDLGPARNQSIKVPLRAMYDRQTAEIVDDLYRTDFGILDYEHETFGDEPDAFELTSNEFLMVERIVSLRARAHETDSGRWERLAKRRTGARYGVGEVVKSAARGLRRIDRRGRTPNPG